MDDLPLPTIQQTFDEQPIGGAPKLMLDEYPPDFDPSKIQTKAEPVPLDKRLVSKVWKIKKQALEELLKIVSNQNHRAFSDHEAVIIKSMADSNIQCQLLSTRIISIFLEKEGTYQSDPKVLIRNSVEKLMTIEKEDIQNLGMQVLFWLMDHKYQEMLMLELNQYLTNKNPKIIGATFKVIQILLNNYGLKKLGGLDIFTKNLKAFAQTARPMAKPQIVELFKEVFKWMGESVFNYFTIHAECKQEVSKWSKTYQIQPMEIKRGLKKGQQGKKVNPMEEESTNDTPVDILHHFDSRWVDATLQIVKWQQKKQHLEDFIKKTNVNAIVPRETSHYITLIKRLFTQNNINLLQCGFRIVKNLCKALKKAFSISCKSFLPYVYLKLKDSKAMIVDEALATLKVMTYSITLEDLQSEITQGLKDKSPPMRSNTLKLLKDLGAKKQPKTTKILKSLLGTLISLTNDSTSEVRDVALAVLCKIKEHHGMIFFEDKLESLPTKKINQIRSTPTIGQNQQFGSKMQIQDNSFTFGASNNSTISQLSMKNNISKNKENTIMIQQQKKKPNQVPVSETQLDIKKTISKSIQPVVQKKSSFPTYAKQKQQPFQTIQSVHKMKEQENNSLRDPFSEEIQITKIRNEQWPIVPNPGHVLRLINLFTKLGEPFLTLATPFKLKNLHFQIVENFQNTFITENADLLLKWALWRIQIQNPDIIEKVTSIVIHLVFLLKNKMSDSQTVLVMSILSNLLESDFTRTQMLHYINTGIVQMSQFLREKVFNFWITTINQSTNNSQFCNKILELLQSTFSNIPLNCSEIVAMARVQPITRSNKFMDFLLTKTTREILKVSGFKLEDQQKQGYEYILKQSECHFYIDIKIEQRHYFLEVFKKISHEAMEEIRKIQQSLAPSECMKFHIKILDTIMVPYLAQSLQTINVYNYFKFLSAKIIMMCQPRNMQIDNVTPYLRDIMRLLMFFLIDSTDSRLDNKDEMVKTINKIILVLLQKMPADYLLEVMTMLLKYSIENNLTKRLSSLLIKCIQRTINGVSFSVKALKNVKFLFNFIISLIEQHKITDEDSMIAHFKNIFSNIMMKYKELCMQIVIQKLEQFKNKFISLEIESMFRNFIGYANRNQQNPQNNLENTNLNQLPSRVNINERVENRAFENNQSMSNLPQGITIHKQQNISFYQSLQQQNQVIREATNIPRRSQAIKPLMNTFINNSLDLVGNQGGQKILQERKRIQNLNGLCQSLEQLQRMKEELIPSSSNQVQASEKLKESQSSF